MFINIPDSCPAYHLWILSYFAEHFGDVSITTSLAAIHISSHPDEDNDEVPKNKQHSLSEGFVDKVGRRNTFVIIDGGPLLVSCSLILIYARSKVTHVPILNQLYVT